MPKEQVSRVAEMLFHDEPLCDFARTVAEMETGLARICGQRPKLTWDCDDVASFDMPGVRILLSQSESPYPGFASRLVVSVGPSPIAALLDQGSMVHASICVRLVNRLKERCPPAELRWNDIKGVVTAEDVDLLAEGMATRERKFEQKKKRPGIFTPHIGRAPDNQSALRDLRAALRRDIPETDMHASWNRVADSAYELAATMAILPASAMHFAASWYRMAVR